MAQSVLLVLEVHVTPDDAIEVFVAMADSMRAYGPVPIGDLAGVLETIAATGALPEP